MDEEIREGLQSMVHLLKITDSKLADMKTKFLAAQKELSELEEQLIAKDRRIAELELNTPALRYAVQTVEKLHSENQRLRAVIDNFSEVNQELRTDLLNLGNLYEMVKKQLAAQSEE